ncbi:sugar phosphate isomerase/epimerase [Paenibacillus rhizosphaerae]|uniref:Sugar phosphate isomerase/epimerase n=1 Tax=Paenibacillus rhizosphaerae TaxID=297318 RepID=A0A839TGE3_9BACL|nr:TIM barrel protein [Paenibacillus rhizosphaerae]MBB3125644.1 sugar phosphate isomerase/epimerase [Paenibacillus rhizosphaerae]
MDKGDYSYSTCWNIKNHKDGRAMIEEIKGLGFGSVELNYNVTQGHLATIEPMIERGEIRISSVHHAFPFVDDKEYDTDSVMLGYEDESKRRRAVELLEQSVEYAVRYGAGAVVVHPGEVPFPVNVDAQLKRIYRDNGPESMEYRELWEQMAKRREAEAPAYLERIRRSLEEISDYIARKGYRVAVGIETRARCNQIPTLREAGELIAGLKGSPVGLWYDIGHAMMMDRMGLYDNLKDLPAVSPYIVGVHIHETIGLSDHWCPYVHSKDDGFFDHFLEIIDRSPIKVYELKSQCLPEEIDKSHALITSKIASMKG